MESHGTLEYPVGGMTAYKSSQMPELLDDPKNCETLEQFWDLLFSPDIIELIVEHTNRRIEEVCLEVVI